MRIGISIFGCAAGKSKGAGIGVYSKNLIRSLQVIDSQNLYYIFSSWNNRKLFYCEKQSNFHFVAIPLPENIFTRFVFENVILPILTVLCRLDLIHYTQSRMPLINIKKFVITVYDLMYKYYQENFSNCISPLKVRYFQKNFEKAIQKADGIIAISEYTSKEIQKYFCVDAAKIHVVYGGVSEQYIGRSVSNEVISRQGIMNGIKYILTVKSTFPHKNLHSVIESFVLSKRKYNLTHKLIIVGVPGKVHDLFLNEINAVQFKEDIVYIENASEDELISLYKNADLFMFLSLNEGFGLPVIEAMASGVPVICSNRASLPEVAGDAAYIVDALDVEIISEAINVCISNELLRQDLIRKGLQRVVHFTWRNTALLTRAVYNSIA